jgi:hypothetical protein
MKDEQLNNLFSYTQFHIGLYITLITAIIGVFANEKLRDSYSNFLPFVLISI